MELLIFCGYIIVIGGVIIFSSLAAWGFVGHMIEFSKQKKTLEIQVEKAMLAPKEKKLPHEIFPELVFWRKGDELYHYSKYAVSYKAKYLGVKDQTIYVKHESDDEVKALTVDDLKDYKNYEARKLMHQFDEKKILAEIEGDSYNEFLGVLREETIKFMGNDDRPTEAGLDRQAIEGSGLGNYVALKATSGRA